MSILPKAYSLFTTRSGINSFTLLCMEKMRLENGDRESRSGNRLNSREQMHGFLFLIDKVPPRTDCSFWLELCS